MIKFELPEDDLDLPKDVVDLATDPELLDKSKASVTGFTTELVASVTAIKQQNNLFPMLLCFFCGCLLTLVVAREFFPSGKNDRQEQVEPNDEDQSEKQDDKNKIAAVGATFVFVYEFQTKTAEQELLVRDLPAWSQINKCEFRTFDQDSKSAEVYKAAAEKVGIVSPFMAVVRNNKVSRVFNFPRDRGTLERLVK